MEHSTGVNRLRQVFDPHQPLLLPAIALATCGGYYLGSLVGLQLRIPPATTSIFWPPNAVLTAALVLTWPRRWPIILLSALPAHVYLQLHTGWPLTMILGLFVTNCLEAVIAAGGMNKDIRACGRRMRSPLSGIEFHGARPLFPAQSV